MLCYNVTCCLHISEPSSSAPEISHVDILPTSSSSSSTSSSSPGKLCLLSKQISYHMFFCLMHIYIYDIILDIILSSVLNCSHKIWCICAHMMCCNCDMYFVNISATSSSVAVISAIDVSPTLSSSSSSSSSSSLPGNLSHCYSTHDIIYFLV